VCDSKPEASDGVGVAIGTEKEADTRLQTSPRLGKGVAEYWTRRGAVPIPTYLEDRRVAALLSGSQAPWLQH
jgi:hypothetical protein